MAFSLRLLLYLGKRRALLIQKRKERVRPVKINQLMRTNVGAERLPHRVSENMDIALWQGPEPEIEVIYEVVDAAGTKIGEISGERLAYLLKSSRKLDLTHIINTFEDGVVVIDADGCICFENDAYCKIIGVPMRKTVGKNMYVIEPDALLLRVLEQGVAIECKQHLVKSVGKNVSMRMYPIFSDAKVTGAFSVFRDVTELHALGQEVRRITGVAQEFISQINVKNELERLQVVSRDSGYMNLISQAMTVARTDATILIRGENGVGKEVFTKLIHNNSTRREKPFITVNCAAVPENLIESELFGYEEGSFTGAKKGGKIGKFQLAEGGTLFLDEIGDMPLTMQTKLLRVLQEGEIEKIGRGSNIPVNVRVIAATNQPLEEMLRDKFFRQDLYYRLNVISLTIPPLRERRADILLLADHFLHRFNEKYEKSVVITREVYDLLENYDWPGNIRELQNCIESCVIMCSGDFLTPHELPASFRCVVVSDKKPQTFPRHDYRTLREETERYEREVVRAVVEQCGGDREAAMAKLDISRRTLYRKLSASNGI